MAFLHYTVYMDTIYGIHYILTYMTIVFSSGARRERVAEFHPIT